MNFLNYGLRYLFVIWQAVYEENYRDQVKFNEAWLKVVEEMRKK